jgi:hypothetical protein
VTSPQDFFALVELHLARPMLDAGYAKIGEFDGERVNPNSRLLSAGSRWRRRTRFVDRLCKRRRGPKVRVLQVGYEELVGDDEKWLDYYPGIGELDLIRWRDILDGHADWNVFHDRLVPDDGELERRLVVLSSALRKRQSG